jgi:hypothetical protein
VPTAPDSQDPAAADPRDPPSVRAGNETSQVRAEIEIFRARVENSGTGKLPKSLRLPPPWLKTLTPWCVSCVNCDKRSKVKLWLSRNFSLWKFCFEAGFVYKEIRSRNKRRKRRKKQLSKNFGFRKNITTLLLLTSTECQTNTYLNRTYFTIKEKQLLLFIISFQRT